MQIQTHPPSRALRPLVARLARAALLSASLAALPLLPAMAAPVAVKAVKTDLSSNNERVISYRHQQHMVQTADGALHLMLNRGTLTPGPGLSLYSSFDGGTTWSFMHNFELTDDKSTGDVLLAGSELSVAYHTIDNKLMFTRLQYDSALRTWTPLLLELAYASGQWAALNPTLAIDDLGTVWMGFNAKGRFNGLGNLRLVNRVGGGNVWTDPNLVFGPTDKKAVERSARPVRLPGGVGMVWTVHEVTYWSRRSNGMPDNSLWSQLTLYTGLPATQIEDPYASHFNVTTDDTGGVHLISVEEYDVLYFKYANSTDSWTAPTVVDDGRKVAYAQMGLFNGKLAVGYSVQRSKGTLALSPDLGSTWTNHADLSMLAIGPGINLNTARVELPARSVGVLPMLQQYEDNGTQRLMLFKIPAP